MFGAATWGLTREEAFRHINEVVAMIVDELREDGIEIPQNPELACVSDSRVAVTV